MEDLLKIGLMLLMLIQIHFISDIIMSLKMKRRILWFLREDQAEL